MTKPFRVLVTGSRDWEDGLDSVANALGIVRLENPGRRFVIIHGGAQGADALASIWAWVNPEASEEKHPANWKRYGKRAGPIRNAEMVALGADLCLAFIRDSSRGASHCAGLAEKAGIPIRRYTA